MRPMSIPYNRDFKIYHSMTVTMAQNLHIELTKTKVLNAFHMLFLLLCISFMFSANVWCEMTISQVSQRMWTQAQIWIFFSNVDTAPLNSVWVIPLAFNRHNTKLCFPHVPYQFEKILWLVVLVKREHSLQL